MKSTSDLVAVPTPLPIGPVEQREAAFIRLLAEAIASDIRRGGTLADEPEILFEDHSACSNFSFDLAGSTDIERKEDS